MIWIELCVCVASSGVTAGVALWLFRRKMKALATSVTGLKDLSHVRILYEIKHGKLASDLQKIF
jgi:hypothetical protein